MITLVALSAALAQDPAPTEDSTVEASEVEPAAEEAAGPDRSQRPAVVPAQPLELPEAEVVELRPGIRAHIVRLEGVRKVEIELIMRRGLFDVDGAETWAGNATGHLWDLATTSRDPEDIELLSSLHDLSVWTSSTGLHQQAMYMDVPRVDLDVGLELLADTLMNPTFPAKELKRYRQEQAFYWTAIAPTDLGTVTSQARAYAWYPEDHPFGTPRDLEQLSEVKTKDLLYRVEALRQAGPIDILIVGDVTKEDLEPTLSSMVAEIGAVGERRYAPVYEGLEESRIVAVNLPGEQAAVRLRMAGPRFDHPDRDTAALVDFALGGHFLSRLNRNLREDKGLTYGSGSYLRSGRSAGTWDVSVDVKVENVGVAMTEIEREIAAVAADGVEASEIESAVGERVQSWNRTRLTASTGSGRYGSLLEDEETAAEARDRLLALSEVPVEETQRVASEWLGAEAPRLWVITGDRAQLEETLGATDLPITWIEPHEAVFGSF